MEDSYNFLRGRHVLVTGATGDIGVRVAKLCARAGAILDIQGRFQEKLTKLKRKLEESTGCTVEGVHVVDFLNVGQTIALVDERPYVFDYVFATHGDRNKRKFKDYDVDEAMNTVKVNCASMVVILRSLEARLDGSPGVLPRMIVIGSRASKGSRNGDLSYASSKAALNATIASLTLEKERIRVTVAEPGIVDTKMAAGRGYPADEMDDPDVVASEVVLLASTSNDSLHKMIVAVGPKYRDRYNALDALPHKSPPTPKFLVGSGARIVRKVSDLWEAIKPRRR